MTAPPMNADAMVAIELIFFAADVTIHVQINTDAIIEINFSLFIRCSSCPTGGYARAMPSFHGNEVITDIFMPTKKRCARYM